MAIIFVRGTDSDFLGTGLFTGLASLSDLQVIDQSTQGFTWLNPVTQARTLITGSQFTFDGTGAPVTGNVSLIRFNQGDVEQAITAPAFRFEDLAAALEALDQQGDPGLLIDLFSDNGLFQINAVAAYGPLDLIGGFGSFAPDLSGSLVVTGTIFDDVLRGGPGDDDIEGSAGRDTYVVDAPLALATVTQFAGGFVVSLPGEGTDTVRGVEVLQFTDQSVLRGDLFEDANDLVVGTDASEIFDTGLGFDTVSGGRGDDLITTGDHDDDVRGDGGNDTLRGGEGADTLRGGRQSDEIEGGNGDDVLRGQRDADTLEGGSGDDNIKGGGGNDLLQGEAGNDFLKGGTRRDTLEGGTGDDLLTGNSFDDVLDGGAGNDILRGGGENDRLIGGTENDTLKGGGGADTFVFDLGGDEDVILDFSVAEDQLEFSALLAGGQDVVDLVADADVIGGNVVFDFGGGGEITLLGLNSTAGLENALIIV